MADCYKPDGDGRGKCPTPVPVKGEGKLKCTSRCPGGNARIPHVVVCCPVQCLGTSRYQTVTKVAASHSRCRTVHLYCELTQAFVSQWIHFLCTASVQVNQKINSYSHHGIDEWRRRRRVGRSHATMYVITAAWHDSQAATFHCQLSSKSILNLSLLLLLVTWRHLFTCYTRSHVTMFNMCQNRERERVGS